MVLVLFREEEGVVGVDRYHSFGPADSDADVVVITASIPTIAKHNTIPNLFVFNMLPSTFDERFLFGDRPSNCVFIVAVFRKKGNISIRDGGGFGDFPSLFAWLRMDFSWVVSFFILVIGVSFHANRLSYDLVSRFGGVVRFECGTVRSSEHLFLLC